MAKRSAEFHSIKDLMKTVIKENNLTKGMRQIYVKDAWLLVMGKGIQSHTQKVSLQGATLLVELKSAVLREELSYGIDKIRIMMNEALGEELIKKVRLL